MANPPYSSGTDIPNPPISAMPEMISSGMSVLARWMCSARGRICSSANRWKVSRTNSKSASRWRSPGTSASEARKAGSRKVVTNSSAGAIQSIDTPHCRARPSGARRQISQGVGDESAGDAGLGVAVGSVGEHRLGRADRGRGMGHVVGQDLRRVGPTRLAQRHDPGIDHRLGHRHGVGRGRQIGDRRGGWGHRPRLSRPVTREPGLAPPRSPGAAAPRHRRPGRPRSPT